jgi:hypothetical protein
MSSGPTLHLHVNPDQVQRHAEGTGRVLNVVTDAVQAKRWSVEVHSVAATNGLPTAKGYHIVYSQDVFGGTCLNLRRCYRDPFFCIEPTNERWEYEVAYRPFDPAEVVKGFRGFYSYWRPRVLGDMQVSNDGHVLIPLQGRLLEHRSFQSMSPIEMIRATMEAETSRPVYATLHPKEIYTAEERAALREIAARYPRFQLSEQPTMKLLAGCDYVVTQNSGVAVTGFFAHKPAVLFGKIDFHHIAGSVPRVGVDEAFSTALGKPPEFAKFLYWFFALNAIPFWDGDAKDRIVERLRHFGWPI